MYAEKVFTQSKRSCLVIFSESEPICLLYLPQPLTDTEVEMLLLTGGIHWFNDETEAYNA
jgi:hypothetical protein